MQGLNLEKVVHMIPFHRLIEKRITGVPILYWSWILKKHLSDLQKYNSHAICTLAYICAGCF